MLRRFPVLPTLRGSAGRLDSDDDSEQSGDGGPAVDTSSQNSKSRYLPIPRGANTLSSASKKKKRKAVARSDGDDEPLLQPEVIRPSGPKQI